MITKQRTLIGLAALFAIASAQACSSDPADPVTTPTGGSAGAPAATGGSFSAGGSTPTPSGGSAVGGSAVGGSAVGGSSVGGSASLGGSSSGGSSPGAGGSSAGSGSGGRAGGSAAGGGSSTATYAAVKTIFSASCGTGTCHNGSPHTNFQMGELHTTLTTAIPTTQAMNACNGTTLVTPGDAAGSFLVKVISNTMSTCKDAGADNMIPKMPYGCGTNPMCLSADKIKTITDWIAAGAKQ